MKRATTFTLALAASLSAIGCSHAGDGSDKGSTEKSATSPAVAAAAAAPATPSPRDSSSHEEMAWPDNPPEKFTDAEKSFATVREAIKSDYYLAGIGDDEIYRAAVQGILEHVDPKMHKWNKLLSPAEVAEIRSDMKGEIVGIGVQIHFDQTTGHVEVIGTIPGSPAEKAGIVAGDLIVTVNGKLYKGMAIHDVVADIRGKPGEAITLSVLRDDKLVPFTITRAVVSIEAVTHHVYDGIGYVRIHGFSAKTTPMLKEAMADLATKQPSALVVDLRMNMGGSFDDAVASAEQFLPAGTPIVTLRKREGKEETVTSKGSPVLAAVPMVVLVNHDTSSGAEFITAALREGRHARVVGARTFGKWSVQTIHDLPNGYAFKLTTSQFFAPSGKTFDGVGITPDVEVDAPSEQVEKTLTMTDPDKHLAADGQLRTALAILAAAK